jgi:hypothetical protein
MHCNHQHHMYIQVHNLKLTPYWKILTCKIQINHCIYAHITKTTNMTWKVVHCNLYWPFSCLPPQYIINHGEVRIFWKSIAIFMLLTLFPMWMTEILITLTNVKLGKIGEIFHLMKWCWNIRANIVLQGISFWIDP